MTVAKYSQRLFAEPSDYYKVESYSNREEWLKGRGHGIGGSDASCVIGMNPYKTNVQLYREKVGIITPEDISEKDAVKYGHEAEEDIRHLFALDHPELEVGYRDNAILVNRKYPWMRYSPDGLLYEPETGRKGILEIKTSTIVRSVKYEVWKDQVPQNYYVQILHGLLVTGFDFVYLRALLKFDDSYSSFKTFYFDRADLDEELAYLFSEEEKFARCLRMKVEPALGIEL